MADNAVVFGAGGFGREAALILTEDERLADVSVVGFLDDDRELWGREVAGLPVLGGQEMAASLPAKGVHHVVVAVGNNRVRVGIARRLLAAGVEPLTVVHNRAYVAPTATLGRGCIVAAGAVVNPGAHVGDYGLINVNACIGHDCRLGLGVQVSPGANLAGNVTLEDYVMVGIGASLIPGITVHEGATVGAGSAVYRDVEAERTALGIPARPVPRPPASH